MSHSIPVPRHILIVAALATACGSARGTAPTRDLPTSAGGALANQAPAASPTDAAPAADAAIPTQAQVAALDEAPYADIEARCTANDLAACTQLGTRLRIGSGGAPHDLPRAYAVLDAACTAQQARGPACSHLAEILVGGHGTPRDTARGVMVLERACSGGELEACRFLGVVLYEGLAAPDIRYSAEAQRRGIDLLQRTCDAGYQRACESAEARRGVSAPP